MSSPPSLAFLLSGASILMTAALAAEQIPRTPQQIEDDNLWAMSRTTSWGHVDLYFEYAGMENYADKHYQAALHDFRLAAYYADKPSQLSLGLMYLQGEGVPRDPAMAWAWVHLAAERGYRAFLATERAIARQLSPEQRQQAGADFAQLALQYADTVAKPHLIRDRRLSMMAINPTGHVPPGMISQAGGTLIQPRPCAMNSDDEPVDQNCSGYPAWRMDADSYFAERDAQWAHQQGHVTVHALQPVPAASAPTDLPAPAGMGGTR
ncbi:SEL1-like repeat protein [Frateuria aurantia]